MQVVLVLCVIFPITASKVIVKNDRYVGYFGKMFQQLSDDSGMEWERPAQPNKLEVLLNDHVEITDSCIDERRFVSAEKVSKDNVTFQEIAKVCHYYLRSNFTILNCTINISRKWCTRQKNTGLWRKKGLHSNVFLKQTCWNVNNKRCRK